MALVSPGVEVSVINDSFYTPAEPGTVPMVFIATAQDKSNPAGTGTASGTLKANAGVPYLLTSQRDASETFGDAIFKTDTNNNPIHAGEQNEYGLQALYSILGVSNRAWAVRADIDLSEIEGTANEPAGPPTNGTYWFDTQNTSFGVFEWNGNPKTTTGGQSFSVQDVLVITDTTRVSSGVPKTSVGAIGDYALVATTTLNKLFYKNSTGTWVEVGTSDWAASWPTVRGTASNPTITNGETVVINGSTVTASGTTVTVLANDINSALISGVTAAAVDGSLEIYTNGIDLTLAEGTGSLAAAGLTAGVFYAPKIQISRHTNVPQYKLTDTNSRPTGSIWVKTTQPNAGARWRVKVYNGDTLLFDNVEAPLYADNQTAISNLDPAGGGLNLAVGDLYVKYNDAEDEPVLADFKIYRRRASGRTTITSRAITSNISAGAFSFDIFESVIGSASLAADVTVTGTATGASSDADVIAGAINSAGLVNIVASVDASNRVVIQHKLGGEFRLNDTIGTLLEMGFSAYVDANNGTVNLYTAPAGDSASSDFLATNWQVLSYTASEDAPTALTTDGRLWYSSVVDEVDIMVHNGNTWVGYLDSTSPFYDVDDTAQTDPAGPIVAATEPTTQSDGTSLVNGDLWIDTADIENYPTIYKYDGALLQWNLVDKTDQTTEDGILFDDARYNTSGANSNVAGDIDELLISNFLDFDAPDPALYPRGMLLWNLRRSGFNVKRFERNYIDVNDDNIRFNNDESMDGYYPHRWVTESANDIDGSGSFGRKAQRKVVVQALQALVNSNQDIRDDESRLFNLMACPGYPELIGEMITLNFDRGLTAFVVADSPARLTPDATSLNNWGTNVNTVVEDNDDGLVSRDEYMGVYYPWGFTSDNFGNNVVVPPSHMMLRTIALNDQIAYPWFAPAGTRRGGITNATSTGYVNNEGEFVAVALNEGQRDTLYSVDVNPITFITGAGLVAYGQKTRARGSSSLDRINVARLVVYLRRQLTTLSKPYLFEPNDKITRDEIKQAAESLLLELVGLRGVYDYLVVCDETNNTPSRIDRNELYLDIAIEPVKAVEFIYIPLRLKNTGEIAGLG